MLSREVLDLNGWWHIWYDEAAPWQSETPLLPGTPLCVIPSRPPTVGWQRMERGLESLPVPGAWSLSRPGYRGVAWQWRPLYVPQEWQGRVVRLHLSGVRLRAEVYLDEKLVGYDLEGDNPFEVDLTDKIRLGRQQELALRITNPGGSTSQRDDAPLCWAGLRLLGGHDMGGIWGDVSLIATSPDYIASADALPAPDLTSVMLRVHLAHGNAAGKKISRDLTLSALIYDATGQMVGRSNIIPISARPDGATVDLAIDISNPKPWTPDCPYCYRAEVFLSGKDSMDQIPVTFGLRTVSTRGSRLFMNDEPFFLRGALSQGWYPHDLSFPSAQIAEQEVRVARALGLNALVMDGSPATPRLLEAADRLGLLIIQDPGIPPAPDPKALDTVEARAFYSGLCFARLQRLARRDGNHPSLVWWRWADAQPDSLAALHSEDPTRLVSSGSMSGSAIAWEPHSSVSSSLYDLGQETSASPVWRDELECEIQSLAPARSDGPMVDSRPTCFPGLPDLPALVRRYGDRVLPGSDAEATHEALRALAYDFDTQHMQRTFANVSDFCRATREPQAYAIRRTLEAHRLNTACSGLVLHEWNSAPMTGYGGLVDVFRRVQVSASGIAQANAPLALALRGLPARVRARGAYSVQVWALNQLGPQRNLKLIWEQRVHDGHTVAQEEWPVMLDGTEWQECIGQIDLLTEISPPTVEDRHTLHLELRDGLRVLAVIEDRFWVSAGAPPWPSCGRILDSNGLLASFGEFYARNWPAYSNEASAVPLFLVSWSSGEELEAILRKAKAWPPKAGQPNRLVLLMPEATPDRNQVLSILSNLLPTEPLSWLSLQNDCFGGWAYSHAHALLDHVADPGVWGHLQADIFPRYVVRHLPGDTLVGGCTLVGAPVPLPCLGTALGIVPWGSAELLFCTLPVVSGCQTRLLSAVQLMHNMACWLTRP